MQNIITYQPRNEVGQYVKISFLKIRQFISSFIALSIKVYRIAKIVTIISVILLAIWGVWLTKEVYQFRCVVNGQNVGYFSRRVECDNAYQNWVNSQRQSIDDHVAQELANNPDLR